MAFMATSKAVLFYNTPKDQFSTYYPIEKSKLPFTPGKNIHTLLPRETALLRTISALAVATLTLAFPTATLTTLAFVISTTFIIRQNIAPDKDQNNWLCSIGGTAIAFVLTHLKLTWLGAVALTAYGIWTAYSHLYKQEDPLVQAFYQIAGGKEKFEKLPEITLDPDKTLTDTVKALSWDKLAAPMSRATLNGRQVVIVKALSRHKEKKFFSESQTKALFVFVEKLSPHDLPPVFSNISPLNDRRIATVVQALWSASNVLSVPVSSSSYNIGEKQGSSCKKIFSTLSTDRANEFYAQLAK